MIVKLRHPRRLPDRPFQKPGALVHPVEAQRRGTGKIERLQVVGVLVQDGAVQPGRLVEAAGLL